MHALTVGHLALVWEAGAGKSRALAAGAAQLHAAGERVVFIDATDPSMANPDVSFHLEHRLADVLAAWGDDGRPIYVFVDGLDRSRVGTAYEAIVRS